MLHCIALVPGESSPIRSPLAMPKPTDPKPFTDTLREYRNGALVRSLSEETARVIAAVHKHHKGGSITLKLKFTPESSGGSGIEVTADVSSSIPKPSLPKAVFFGTEEGGLFRSDPAQMDAFEDTDPETGEITPKLRGVVGGKAD